MPTEPTPSAVGLVGAVLTGGRSRRMGHDKASIDVGGRPLVAVAVDALRAAGATPVLLIGGEPPGFPDKLIVVTVPDDHPGDGPLGGILTALRHPTVRGGEVVVILACDLPWATSAAVGAVVEALRAAPAALAAAPLIDGRLEPLHAAWRPSALATVAGHFEAGERSPQRVLEALGAVPVGGIDPSALRGVNTPDELAAAHPSPEGCADRPDWSHE